MVVFVCGSCNESLKKNSVSLHLNRCRAPVISCCDCNKEFTDNSYQSHNQCISEDSKYGPESQRVYGNNDKGKLKQDVWLNKIKETLKTMKLSGRAEMALNRLLEYPNIPRKQSKFENFANSCLQINSPDLIGQLWSICDSANKAVAGGETKPVENKAQAQPKETTSPNDGVKEDSKSNKKEKKKKMKKNEEETESGISADKEEKSEEPNETQGTESSGQNNGIGDNVKKSKKKMKQVNKEENQETQETNGDEKDKMETEQTEKTDSITEPEPKLDEEMVENEGDKSKKKLKKKKKRNHSETEENDQSNGQVNGNANENGQRKKSKPDEEVESTLDEKIEQDLSTIEGMINELKNDPDNQISWFKQLKRQIKEKETVDLKDFKKMIKKLKKEYELKEEFTDLIAKAKTKLMKRHNYSVSEGQIQYKHLF